MGSPYIRPTVRGQITIPEKDVLHCEYCDTYLMKQQLDKFGCCPNCGAEVKKE